MFIQRSQVSIRRLDQNLFRIEALDACQVEKFADDLPVRFSSYDPAIAVVRQLRDMAHRLAPRGVVRFDEPIIGPLFCTVNRDRAYIKLFMPTRTDRLKTLVVLYVL